MMPAVLQLDVQARFLTQLCGKFCSRQVAATGSAIDPDNLATGLDKIQTQPPMVELSPNANVFFAFNCGLSSYFSDRLGNHFFSHGNFAAAEHSGQQKANSDWIFATRKS